MTGNFIKAILAGICISIGCNIYLACDNKYIGAFLFTIGLITILLFGFNLYTGSVGYIVSNGLSFTKTVFIALIGNAIGCIGMGWVFPSEVATILCGQKLQTPLIDVFCRSIMCGLLMFIAVDPYKTHRTFIPAMFCVPTFIISGYEHSIADISYLIMGRTLTLQALIFIIVVIIGNAIGGLTIPICNKLINNSTK